MFTKKFFPLLIVGVLMISACSVQDPQQQNPGFTPLTQNQNGGTGPSASSNGVQNQPSQNQPPVQNQFNQQGQQIPQNGQAPMNGQGNGQGQFMQGGQMPMNNGQGQPMQDGQMSMNNGQGQPMQGGQQGLQPPQEAIDACANQTQETTCSFSTPNGTITGTCGTPPNSSQLACVPANPPINGGQPPQGGNGTVQP